MQKTIVHVTSSLKMGGAETVLYNIITHMPEYTHHVIYLHGGPFEHKLRDHNVQLHHIKGFLFGWDPLFFVRVVAMIRKIRPHTIHSLLWIGNLAGIIAGRLLGIATVASFHNNIDQNGRFRTLIDRFVLPYADQLVAVSQQVKESVHAAYPQLNIPILIIHNGIDAHNTYDKGVQRMITRSDCGISDDAYVFGSVGRFERVKRYDYLIEAFAQVIQSVPDSYLLLVGVGSQSGYLKSIVQEHNLSSRVIFIEGQSALGYYSLMDCFVQSSAKEGISMALLEAMTFAKPCLVTNESENHPVIVDGKNGFIVDAYDQRALIEIMIHIAQDRAKSGELGHKGQGSVLKNFSMQSMITAYQQVF